MSTNKELLSKGVKCLFYALPCYFIGPSIIFNAFKNQHTAWHYLVLLVGIVVCFFAIFFTFKGLKTILNSMFDK
jgi:predicted membrane channel-forming protein YqfA (hemolysin III family)